MKYLSFIILVTIGFSVEARNLNAYETAPLFEHLFSINEQWIHHKNAAPNDLASFENDIERIQRHLELVVSHLSATETKGLSSNQRAKRNALLDTLKNYAAASVFPTNSYHSKRTPYFIDIYSVYCAVGYLIKASGHDDLAQRIHDEHNYDYIKDIKTPELLEWANAHGFSVDELAWIQPAYQDRTPLVTYGGGANGEVRKIGYHHFGQLGFVNVVIGDFTKLGNENCSGVGYYFEGEWHCIGEGTFGTVYDFESDFHGDTLVLAGNFTHNHQQYGIAFYSLSKGLEFQENPHNGIMIATAIIRDYDENVIAYYLPIEGKTELWEYKDGNAKHLITINGRVNAYGTYQPTKPYSEDATVIGGGFDSYTLASDSSVYPSHNLIMMHSRYGQETSFEPVVQKIQDTVYTIYNVGSVTYIGGRCDTISPTSKNCLTKLVDGAFQTVITVDRFGNSQGDCPCEIRDVTSYGFTQLLIGGDFPITAGMYSGRNLALYNPLSNDLSSNGNLNGPVNTLYQDGDDYIFGGKFSDKDRYNRPLGNLARYYNYLDGVPKPSGKLSIFPNPASNQFIIKSSENLVFTQVMVSSLSGQTILDRTYDGNLSQQAVDVSNLSPGLYLVNATASNGEKMISKLTVE